MKYIVVGLGTFGASLAEKLTSQGHEVIGIDTRMSRVELYKERISHTICMDSTDEEAVSGLPLADTDVVVISIGEDQGANIMATALFKNLGVKRLIGRVLNPLHEKVLQAIGVDERVHPEEETAERWAKKLCLHNVVDSFELSDEYSIIEAKVPEEYIGKSIKEMDLSNRFNILILTTIKEIEVKSLLGRTRLESKVQGVVSADLVVEKSDVLVLYGANQDLKRFLK